MSKETKTGWDAIEVHEQRSGAGKSCTVWPSPCRVASVRKRMTVVEIKTAFGVEVLKRKQSNANVASKSRPAQELQRNSRVDGAGLNLHPAGDVFTHEPLVASVEHVHIVNVVVKLVI